MSSSDDRRRPRVAGHRRRPRPPEEGADRAVAQRPEPATGPTPGAGPTPDAGVPTASPEERQARRRGIARALRAPLAALAAALVLLAAVTVVTLGDPGARDRDARAATAAARADLEQLLSYDHQTLERQAAANGALLTGAFRTEYADTMARTILPLAQKEKAVVRARSYEAGVMAQTDDTVTVQVFLNQAKTSAAQEQPSVDQNRVIATMQRVGERWLIARLEAF
ncbi:hypothetical protein [Oryzobacter terrae]|uniref:hypothetical protein n=1 Tax=Oryzobacter terrae TaxID=1620385 RepID=UPI0036705EC2